MFDVSSDFWTFMLIGFCAQLVDGALGMAFGVISSTFLLSMGQAPVVVSASVHTAEMFTTGFSAVSHAYFKNINWKLCLPLAFFGAIGGVIGATILSNIDGDMIKPFISIYLGLLGLFILWKAAHYRTGAPPPPLLSTEKISALGVTGGILDATGGGGWGPIVTSNLIARGDDPRQVIGSVNSAEFIVTTAVTIAFVVTIGFHFSEVVIGLLAGGVIAAPLGALLVRKVPTRLIMFVVGLLITGLSTWQIVKHIL